MPKSSFPIWSLHRNERLRDDPGDFNRDRFSPDEVKAHHRFSYLPFGAAVAFALV